jgi:hypothetical protein
MMTLQASQVQLVFSMLVLLLNSATYLKAQESKPLFVSQDSWVSASGKWKSASRDPSNDLGKHAVEIQCRLEIRQCLEAQATILGGEPQVSLENYRIIEWDKNGIIAQNDAPICTTNRLLINFQDQSVTAVDMPKKGAKGLPLGDGKNACQLAGKTRTYNLVAPY